MTSKLLLLIALLFCASPAVAQVLNGLGVFAGLAVVTSPVEEIPGQLSVHMRPGPSLGAMWHTSGWIAPHVEVGYQQGVLVSRSPSEEADSVSVDYTDRAPFIYGVLAARFQRDVGPVRPFLYGGPRVDWHFQDGAQQNLTPGVTLGGGAEVGRAFGVPVAVEVRVSRDFERVAPFNGRQQYLYEVRVGVYPFRSR